MITRLGGWDISHKLQTILHGYRSSRAAWTPLVNAQRTRIGRGATNVHGTKTTLVAEEAQRAEALVVAAIREAIWVGKNGGADGSDTPLLLPSN